jgi:hypothetical protein
MPVTYEIYPARNLIRTWCFGDVTLKEVQNHFRELEQDPKRPDRLNVMLDLSGMTSIPQIWELRAASQEVKKFVRSVHLQSCAILVRNEVLFGLMRMFEAFTQRYFGATKVFREPAEAEAWLASQEEKAKPDSTTPPLS